MKWTKFVGTVTAMLCGLSACVPFTAAAEGLFPEPDSLNTSYNSADINRSGSVDITDSTILSQYLLGNRNVTQPRYMDVDNNRVVSAVDRKAILAKIVESTYSNHVDGYSLNFGTYNTSNVYTPSLQQVTQGFYKHNFATNTDTYYTLTIGDPAFPTSISEIESPIGTSDFTPENNADLTSGICRFADGGTGFVVGDHVIATAAHCVATNGVWRTDLSGNGLTVQFPNANGVIDDTSDTCTVIEGHIDSTFYHYNFDLQTPYVEQWGAHDYALITVADDLSDRYHFSLGIAYNYYTSTPFASYNIYCTGYPESDYLYTKTLYTSHDKRYNTASPYSVYRYKTDTEYGSSGAPIYLHEDYTAANETDCAYTVISLNAARDTDHSPSQYNYGPAFTPMILKFYMNNTHISY